MKPRDGKDTSGNQRRRGFAIAPDEGSWFHFVLGNRWVFCRFYALAVLALVLADRLDVSYADGFPEAITTAALSLTGIAASLAKQIIARDREVREPVSAGTDCQAELDAAERPSGKPAAGERADKKTSKKKKKKSKKKKKRMLKKTGRKGKLNMKRRPHQVHW